MNNYNNWTKESLISEIEKLYSVINKKDSTNRSINKGLIELQNRIEKAINYIEENFLQNIISGSEYLITYSPCTDLLNILKGDKDD